MMIRFEKISPFGTPSRVAPRSSFKRGKLAQTLFDIFAVGFLAAFASLLGLCIGIAPFFVLFLCF